MTPPLPTPLDREAITRLLERDPFDTFETCKHGGIGVIHWNSHPYCGLCLADWACNMLQSVHPQLLAALDKQERHAKKMAEALEHCIKVFKSMSDRGAYPDELLPFNQKGMGENPHFLGKQGFQFAVDALTNAEDRP